MTAVVVTAEATAEAAPLSVVVLQALMWRCKQKTSGEGPVLDVQIGELQECRVVIVIQI